MMTNTAGAPEILGSVYYDAHCALCVRITTLLRRVLQSRGYALVPLQAPDAAARLKISPAELFTEMRLIDHSGRVLGGADAIIEVAHHIWWARPMVWAAKMPWFLRGLHVLYASHARHRHCSKGNCALRKHHKSHRVFFDMP